MIAGIGTDIVRVERIINLADKDHGKNKIFTVQEHIYCRAKKHPYDHYAARWAAKEAFFKAWGDPDMAKSDIEVVNEEDGQPRFRFHNISRPANFKAKLSLSHDVDYAIAYVIVEA